MTDRTAVRRSRVYLGFALAAGAFSAIISALIVDGLNDGDWSLGAWEWPETVTTALVVILVGLWVAPLVGARIRSTLAIFGYPTMREGHDTSAYENGRPAPVEIARTRVGRRRLSLQERYEEHHRERREEGDFVFVLERIPLCQEEIGTGRRVLDLGCRSGALTQHFLEGNAVVGIDLDRAALGKAATRGIETVEADVETPLTFPDGSFDAIVAGELLEHLRFPDVFVEEVRRVLRPGGVFVGSVPNAFRLQSRLRFLRGHPPEDDPTHLHVYSPAAIRTLLAGFEGVRIAFVGGRYRRLHPRLLARDLVFGGTRNMN